MMLRAVTVCSLLVVGAGCGAPAPRPAAPAPAAAATTAPAAPTPAAPSPTLTVLAGTRVEAPTVHAAFVRPAGWVDRGTAMTDGEPIHVLTPTDPALAELGVIMVLRRPITEPDRDAPFVKVLEGGIRATLPGLEPTYVLAPEPLELGGRRGGRAIARAVREGTAIELYVAGLLEADHGYVVMALYTPEHAAVFRPATETVISTLDAAR